MKRLWFNHWFSTAYTIIGMIKENYDDVYVIGTNEREYAVNKNACDEWYIEPVLKDEEYAQFCLDFCKEHDIQYFFPRRGIIPLSKHKDEFEKIGVRILVDDYDKVSILNQKQKAYEFFKENGIGIVPDYYIVNTVGDFKEAYEKLLDKYEQICFKFVQDEGGKSFRLIDNNRRGYEALFKKQTTRMTFDDVVLALSEREEFDSIMIMPYLSGDEMSVDSLNTSSGLISLPRVKGYNNYESIRFDEDILKMCRDFQDKVGLECPYNIQFKYLNDIPYFLEVNTRMSGGIHMACHACGVNIPQLALKKLAGEEVKWNCDTEDKVIGQVLKPVVIK